MSIYDRLGVTPIIDSFFFDSGYTDGAATVFAFG